MHVLITEEDLRSRFVATRGDHVDIYVKSGIDLLRRCVDAVALLQRYVNANGEVSDVDVRQLTGLINFTRSFPGIYLFEDTNLEQRPTLDLTTTAIRIAVDRGDIHP